MNEKSKHLTHCVLPVIIGGMIYILFRPWSLLMFRWAEYANIDNSVLLWRDVCASLRIFIPDMVIFSLPNGLWAYSLFYFGFIYHSYHRIAGLCWLFAALLLSCGAEILQGAHVVSGTFDPVDLVVNVAGMFAAYILYSRSSLMKKFHSHFWAGCVLALFAILAIGSSDGGSGGAADITAKIGETVKSGDYEITVNSVSQAGSVGSRYMPKQPAGGATFVVVNYTIKNAGSKPVSSFLLPECKVFDQNNVKYDKDPEATTSYKLVALNDFSKIGDLNPGISLRDAAVFEIAIEQWNKAGWKLRIDADKDIEVPLK